MSSDEEVLACPDCDRTPVVANAPGGRSHGSSEKYRCARCGWKGDEPRRRPRRGEPDLRPDSLAAKLDKAESGDLVSDGGRCENADRRERVEKYGEPMGEEPQEDDENEGCDQESDDVHMINDD